MAVTPASPNHGNFLHTKTGLRGSVVQIPASNTIIFAVYRHTTCLVRFIFRYYTFIGTRESTQVRPRILILYI